jgi:hypothetical protein
MAKRSGTRAAPGAVVRTLFITLVFALSCSHTRDELTASEHRSEAARLEENARKESAQYDPGQTVRFPGRDPYVQTPDDWTTTYNPTVEHLYTADRELRAAAEHLAAAKTLETFESAACQQIPAAERAACPLLASSVAQVRETPAGIDLVLKPTVDGDDTQRRLSCHLAYAGAKGFTQPSCPLFVRGTTAG